MPSNQTQQQVSEDERHISTLLSIIPAAVAQNVVNILPFLSRLPPKPMRTSPLSGRDYIDELLISGNEVRIQEVLCMKLRVFQFLCAELRMHGGLTPSRHVSVEEQVAMFLYTVSQGASNRNVQERFQHSGETVSRYFHQVLQAIHRLVPIYIKCSDSKIIPAAIKHNSQFNSFFDDCIGAIDGTHIAAKVPDTIAPAFRNRKGYISQNVLATCDFDNLIFTYVLAGWEGSQHDGAVFESAFEHGFEVPAGKYYLGDAGFGLTPFCLTPYRGVRYHLREWSKAKDR
jgi:hypothetical protein